MFKDCIILFGGSSEEKLVSVASAQNLSTHLSEAELVFISPEGAIFKISHQELQDHANPFTASFIPKSLAIAPNLQHFLPELKNKIVIIALHGTEGEDGSLQEILEKNKIKYTGSDSVASKKAFDKSLTKVLAHRANLSVAKELLIDQINEQKYQQVLDLFHESKKIVLKPNANGSSVGLFICESIPEIESAWESIKEKKILPYMAEPFLKGREITVGVAQNSAGENYALPCSEAKVVVGRKFDYEGKYLGSGVQEITPAELTPEQTKSCQTLALKVHQTIGCRGYSRTDMILNETGPTLLEINTLPGLSKASFIPQQLKVKGISLREFFIDQVQIARDS